MMLVRKVLSTFRLGLYSMVSTTIRRAFTAIGVAIMFLANFQYKTTESEVPQSFLERVTNNKSEFIPLEDEIKKEDAIRKRSIASVREANRNLDRTKLTKSRIADRKTSASRAFADVESERSSDNSPSFNGGSGGGVSFDSGSSFRAPSASVDLGGNSTPSSDNTGSELADTGNEQSTVITGGEPFNSGSNEENNTETDTSDFTEVSDKKDSGISELNCSFDRPQGVYGSSFQVTLTCSSSANITFCIQLGGGFCDPTSGGTSYTGPVDLNSGDNIYGLSFFGTSTSSGVDSSVTDLTYTIDSTPPDLTVSFPKIQIQSTEVPLLSYIQSTDFGKTDHFYYQFNYKTHDQSAFNCSDMFDNVSTLTTPTPSQIETGFDTSVLDPSDQLEQSADFARLDFGDNFVATFIEDRSRNLFACQTQNILIKDFQLSALTATGETNVSSGVRTTSGSFVSYGHYRGPASSSSGTLEDVDGTISHVSGLLDIIY